MDFPYTHNLTYLLDLCATQDAWANRVRDPEELTPYAVSARYPGEDEEVTRAEALRAIETAERVRAESREAMRGKGKSLPSDSTP